MNVNNFVIHAIRKEKGKNKVEVVDATNLLPIDNNTKEFAETAFNLFFKQSKGLLWAGFEETDTSKIFQNYLNEKYNHKKISFLDFSKKGLNHLAETMKTVTLSTGGFMIFLDASHDGEDLLCILFLSQELKFSVDEENLTLKNVPALDLERMGVGCYIKLSGWKDSIPEPVAYVRGKREISDYFRKFIGAQPKKDPKEASQEITAHAKNFLSDKDIEGDECDERLKRMYDYCKKQFQANEPVELNVIGNIIYQENPEEFCQGANKKGISSEFHVNERHLKGLLVIEYNKKGVKLKLDRSAVRDNVEVDLEKRRLTLKDVDEQTLAEINESLGHA